MTLIDMTLILNFKRTDLYTSQVNFKIKNIITRSFVNSFLFYNIAGQFLRCMIISLSIFSDIVITLVNPYFEFVRPIGQVLKKCLPSFPFLFSALKFYKTVGRYITL